jgi:hypothetical protein
MAYAKLLDVLARQDTNYAIMNLVPSAILNPTNDQRYWCNLPAAVVDKIVSEGYSVWPILRPSAGPTQYKQIADVLFVDPNVPLNSKLLPSLEMAGVSLCQVSLAVYTLLPRHLQTFSPTTLHATLMASRPL